MGHSTSFNQYEVVLELRKRGWGEGTAPGKAFTLNKRTGKKRKSDQLLRWEPVGAITVKQLNAIIATSPNPRVAASRVEAVCLNQPDPQPEPVPVNNQDVEALVADRVQEEVAKALTALGIDKDGLELLQAAKAARIPKKRGRPRKQCQETTSQSSSAAS